MECFIPSVDWPTMTDSQTWAVLLACIMMACDVLAGFVGACIQHEVSSSKMREGLGHKILILVMIAMAYVLGVGLSHVSGVNVTIPSTEAVCYYVVVMEISSVLENVRKAWPDVSKTDLFRAFRNVGGSDEGNDDDADNATR